MSRDLIYAIIQSVTLPQSFQLNGKALTAGLHLAGSDSRRNPPQDLCGDPFPAADLKAMQAQGATIAPKVFAIIGPTTAVCRRNDELRDLLMRLFGQVNTLGRGAVQAELDAARPTPAMAASDLWQARLLGEVFPAQPLPRCFLHSLPVLTPNLAYTAVGLWATTSRLETAGQKQGRVRVEQEQVEVTLRNWATWVLTREGE